MQNGLKAKNCQELYVNVVVNTNITKEPLYIVLKTHLVNIC